jgi:3-phosphoglycerate kinase
MKAIIVLKDNEETEEVEISVDFNPPLKDSRVESQAQIMAAKFLEFLKNEYD